MTSAVKLTDSEIQKRKYLEETKPYVWKKVQRFEEKLRQGESIAIIQMQYSYVCNLKCQHCAILPLQGKQTVRTLKPADVADLAKQADELGLARFVITGGEPLVFSDLDEIVAAINPKRFYINVDTNGWLLDDAKAKHLKEIGVDRIQLSIDSFYPNEHDAFRGRQGSHERAMKAVDSSLNVGLQIFIQTVVTKKRLYSDEFIKFIEYFNRRGIGVFVTYAKPVGAWQGNYDDMVTKEDMHYFSENLEKKYNVFTHLTHAYGLDFGCIAVKQMFTVTHTGDVLPCPYIQVSLGNIFKEPLKTIIQKGLSINFFGEKRNTCLIAEDVNFIKNYIDKKTYGKALPVPSSEVFGESEKTITPFNCHF